MIINNWAIALFALYAISLAYNIICLGQGNTPHIEATTKGKKGAAGVTGWIISFALFLGALGTYA